MESWNFVPQMQQLLLGLCCCCLVLSVCHANINSDVVALYGGNRVKLSGDGREVDLSMDQYSGSGFQSKNAFIFGKFDILIKLVPGNSAGTVTTLYLNSTRGTIHDEIDIEFLGNLNGKLYEMQTNIFTRNVGNREQRIHLWFDPTTDFHKYTILWNPQRIIFYVDDIPIRVFEVGNSGVPYPSQQPMTLYATLWDGSDWATDGGRIKVDWKLAPFVASYRDLNVNACVWSGQGVQTSCSNSNLTWMNQTLNLEEQKRLAWVRKNYMFYDYCTARNHQTSPECSIGLLY